MKIFKNPVNACCCFFTGILAFIVYNLTISPGPYPADSTTVLLQSVGLLPKPGPGFPLWASLVNAVSLFPFGTLSGNINFLTTLFGATSVALLCSLISRIISSVVETDERNRRSVSLAANLGGTAAALFLAFSIPFWVACNRGHPAAFHMFLLLVCAHLLFLFVRRERPLFLFMLAFLYGVGIVELPTFIIFLPLLAAFVLYLFLQEENFRFSLLWGVVVFGLLGLCYYFVAAWQYYGSEGYHLRDYGSYLQILKVMVRNQFATITRSLPRAGWLLILLLTAIPWLTCLGTARRSLNGEKDWGHYILHVIMTLAIVLLLFNAPFTPWALLGFGRILVTPYLLAASVFGYLVAYWLLLPSAWWEDTESRFLVWVKKWGGLFLAIPLVALGCVAPFRNIAVCDARPARFAINCADEILNVLKETSTSKDKPRSWLVTDGSLDGILMVKAYERGFPLRVLNTTAGNNSIYLEHISSFFDKPRLKNLARIGVVPVLGEWFRSDSQALNQVAVQWPADILAIHEMLARPHGLVFTPAKDLTGLNSETILKENEQILSKFGAMLNMSSNVVTPADSLQEHLGRHMSLVANNTGVMLEDLGDIKGALSSYTMARNLYAGNVSALINIAGLINKGVKVEDSDRLVSEFDALKNREDKLSVPSLSVQYGQVRSPAAFTKRGVSLALGGFGGLAVTSLNKALLLSPEEGKTEVQDLLARTYAIRRQFAESEAVYNDMLKREPGNYRALFGLTMLAVERGDMEKARKMFLEAKNAGADAGRLAILHARILCAEKSFDEARKVLTNAAGHQPDLDELWIMLVDLMVSRKDLPSVRELASNLGKKNVSVAVRAYAEGWQAMMEKEWDSARKSFEAVIAFRPDMFTLVELLLKLDFRQGRRDDAQVRARQILSIDSGSAFANYFTGVLRMNDGEDALAEEAFRISLERERSPLVLNDFAWLLQKIGRLEEAEKMIHESLAITSDIPEAWDTLGYIQMKTGKTNEAQASFEKALSMRESNYLTRLHLAELHIFRGDSNAAREIVTKVKEARAELSQEELGKLKELRKKLNL